MRVFIGLILCFAYVNCKIFSECNGKPGRTYVASYRQTGCRSFIYCNGVESFEEMCSVGLAFNPIELTCDPKEAVYCDDDIEMNNNDSPAKSPSISPRIVGAMTKQHPTPPGRPLRTTETNLPMRSTPKGNSNRPVPTSKPLGFSTIRPKPTSKPVRTNSPTKLTSLILSTTRKNTQLTSESHVHIPTPPGSQNIPYHSKEPILTTFPEAKTEPTWLPTETTTYILSTKSHPKTKTPSSPPPTPKPTQTLSPTTKRYQTELLTSSTVTKDTETSIQEQCHKKTVGSFAHPDDCRYYYRCMKGVLNKQQCPTGFGWDAKSKMCTSKGCSK